MRRLDPGMLTNADVAAAYGRPWEDLTLVQQALSDEFMATRPACCCTVSPWARLGGAGPAPRWELPARPGAAGQLVTDYAIRQFGRAHIEGLLAGQGAPPLPAAAWDVLAA
jgi:hypothetical protein